jgi:galactokinase
MVAPSLRDDYEVSTPELDAFVETAVQSSAPGQGSPEQALVGVRLRWSEVKMQKCWR